MQNLILSILNLKRLLKFILSHIQVFATHEL